MTGTPTCPFCRFPLRHGRCRRCEGLVLADSGAEWDSSDLIAKFQADADLGDWWADAVGWLQDKWRQVEPNGPSVAWVDGEPAAGGPPIALPAPEPPFRLGEAVPRGHERPVDTPEATRVRVVQEPCALTDRQRADSDRLLRLVWPEGAAE